MIPGRPRLANSPEGLLSSDWELALLMIQNFGLLLISGMLMMWPMGWRITPVFGQMVAGRVILLVGSRLLVLVCTSLPLRRLSGTPFGRRLKSMVMLDWSVAVPSCRFRVHSRRCSVRYWLCKPFGLVISVSDNLNVVRSIDRLLDRDGFSLRNSDRGRTQLLSCSFALLRWQ